MKYKLSNFTVYRYSISTQKYNAVCWK